MTTLTQTVLTKAGIEKAENLCKEFLNNAVVQEAINSYTTAQERLVMIYTQAVNIPNATPIQHSVGEVLTEGVLTVDLCSDDIDMLAVELTFYLDRDKLMWDKNGTVIATDEYGNRVYFEMTELNI